MQHEDYCRVTLNQKDQAIEIAGLVHKRAHNRGHDALFVERSGNTRRLSAIHVAELDLVFDPNPQAKYTSDGKPRRMEELQLTQADSQW